MTTILCLYSILILAVDNQVFPSVLTRIGQNSIEQGIILSSFFLLLPFSSAFAGLAADRMGKKTILLAGSFFLVLPFALSAGVERLWVRAFVLLLFGIGAGSVEGQASALLTDIHPGRERSIINLSQVFYSLGAAFGPLAISFALGKFPGLTLSRLQYSIAAVSVSVMAGFLLLKEGVRHKTVPVTGGFRTVLGERQGRLLLVAMFFYVAAEMGTAGWLAKYTEVYLLIPSALSPLSLTLFWAGLGLSRALVSFFFRNVRDTHLLTAALLLSIFSRLAAFTLNQKTVCMTLFFFIGFGMGTVWPTLVAIIGRRYRNSSGSAVGLINASGGIAVPIMHQVIGILSRENLFGLRYTMLGLGIFSLMNLFIVNRIVEEVSFMPIRDDENSVFGKGL